MNGGNIVYSFELSKTRLHTGHLLWFSKINAIYLGLLIKGLGDFLV